MSEAQIRELVINQLPSAGDGWKVIEEVQVGIRRVDLAGFDGTYLHGYEIKSDADNLKRLPAQLEAYSKVFDTVTVVCGPKHLEKVLAACPEWVCVLVANEGSTYLKRHGDYNPNRDLNATASLLWCAEMRPILKRHGLSQYGGKSTLISRLVGAVPAPELVAIISAALRDRPVWARLSPEAKARKKRARDRQKRRREVHSAYLATLRPPRRPKI